MNFKFIGINALVLFTCMALLQFTFEPIAKTPLPHIAFHSLFVFLFFTNLVGYALLDAKMTSKPKDFVNTFMLVSAMRMLFSLLIVVALILYAGKTAKFLAIYFVTGYMLFLIVEVVFLFKRSKAK